MKIGSRRFRPGWLMTVFAVAALFALVSLGNWQVRRAAEKLAVQQRYDERSQAPAIQVPSKLVDAGSVEYAHISARGEFLPQHTILLDNRVLKGVVGYQVLTPLRIEGGSLNILVNRGWVAATSRRDLLPQVPTPAGTQAVEGIATPPPRRFFELGHDTVAGPVWENLALDRYAAASGLALQPFLLQQTSASDDGLARVAERPDTGVNMHRGYAFQWYAMAALVLVLYFFLNLKPDAATDEKQT